MHGFYIKQPKASLVAPVEEFAGGTVIGSARVRVANVSGEKFDEAATGLAAARGDQRRHDGVTYRGLVTQVEAPAGFFMRTNIPDLRECVKVCILCLLR